MRRRRGAVGRSRDMAKYEVVVEETAASEYVYEVDAAGQLEAIEEAEEMHLGGDRERPENLGTQRRTYVRSVDGEGLA